MKVCSKCGEEKELSEFNFRSDSGKYRNDCKTCKKHYNKDYYKNNSEEIIKNVKEYSDSNRDKKSEYIKQYYAQNRDLIIAKNLEYYKKNKKHLRYADNINRKNRRINDSIFKLKCNIQRRISHSLTRNNFTKKSRTHEILGCSISEFKIYLESKFEDWMNWDNYGNWNGIVNNVNMSWDVDHIIPLSSAKTEDDIIKLNHYTNLQPLCSYVNRVIKRDKILN